jgi:hypothetical protein
MKLLVFLVGEYDILWTICPICNSISDTGGDFESLYEQYVYSCSKCCNDYVLCLTYNSDDYMTDELEHIMLNLDKKCIIPLTHDDFNQYITKMNIVDKIQQIENRYKTEGKQPNRQYRGFLIHICLIQKIGRHPVLPLIDIESIDSTNYSHNDIYVNDIVNINDIVIDDDTYDNPNIEIYKKKYEEIFNIKINVLDQLLPKFIIMDKNEYSVYETCEKYGINIDRDGGPSLFLITNCENCDKTRLIEIFPNT